MSLPPLAGTDTENRDRRLLFAVDLDTQVLLAAVVHDASRPVDGSALLARIWLPADLRADWPSGRTAPVSQPVEQLPPLIRPQVLLIEQSVALSARGLTDTCRRHGIKLQRTATVGPQAKAMVERMGARLSSRFSDFAEATARDANQAAGRPTDRLQELLDLWSRTVWPHQEEPTVQRDFRIQGGLPAGLRRYAGLVTRAGWVPTPPPPSVFVELLSSARRKVGPAGVYLRGRRYSGPGLDELHGPLPASAAFQERQVRYDPFDARRVWVSAGDQRWIALTTAPGTQPSPLPPTTELTVNALVSLHHSPARPAPADMVISPSATVPPPAPATPVPVDAPAQVRVAYHARLPLHTPDVLRSHPLSERDRLVRAGWA
ncbi:Mu transposase C-terminal domain-containing protein [Streptomyces marianii]|uniref:Transposase-like Mu C-terminal domain-containing protein n=1 Tax=Streptomyces marianii TaxID=1817406 RepID=A0A5R9EEP0_9ACTN|nr:Mu transposase C-terminal domain-containing protein [Streptomyces marianii]TLQ46363.1 hypothetical protein FEF34_28280 [Streptomyces marianii]